jgi:hypothetical protein
MPAWNQIEQAEPRFAARIQLILDAHIHKTMATLRRDGSPRISGTEVTFKDGELWLGGKSASRKAQDLLRDGRVAIHSAPLDPEMVEGDVKLSARAIPVTDAAALARTFEVRPPGAVFFRLDIDEVVLTRVVSNQLEVEMWTPADGLRALIPR